MQKAAIIATGASAGGRILQSREIDTHLGKPAGWLERASGVACRPVLADGETQESLALQATRQAMDEAELSPGDLDLFLFASAVGRQPIPATAALLKRELGALSGSAGAFDINATCLSAIAAMEVASLYIETGRAKTVLLVSSEIATRALPWADDPATAGLFGDGAAAMILAPANGSSHSLQIRETGIETWAEGYDYCALAAGGTRYDYDTERTAFEENSLFRMDGHALFKLTRKRLPGFIDRLLARTGWHKEEVDLVVPHQASPLALEHMIRKCGFAREKVLSTVRETGNMVAASLPMTLDHARRTGRIQPGSRILMIGTSAGVSIGGATLEA